MARLILFMIAAAVSAGAGRADAPSLDRVKRLCRGYVAGFVSPATGLAYGRRIDGPGGVGVLESPAEIARGRVRGEARPWGYGSGIEDTAYHTGMLLFALCDAEEATGDPELGALARLAFRGLERMSVLSPVPGFVPRGPHPADPNAYYRDSSLDQHSLYVCALWRWFRGRLATPADRESVARIVAAVVGRLERAGWSVQVEDGSGAAHAGGSMLRMEPSSAALLLTLLAAARDVTGDGHWRAEYERFDGEADGRRWTLLAGAIDRVRPYRYTLFLNQGALRCETLRRIEPDPARRSILGGRIAAMAEDMIACPYFKSWRRLDWLGEESWEAASGRGVADAYLKPLGLTVDSDATVMDLWRRFDLNRLSPPALGGRRNRYEPLTLATPAMVWQIALLSGRPDLVARVRPAVRDMPARVDPGALRMGWAFNYAVLAALWDVARSP